MAERQKYEQWLRDLDAKKDSTPKKVFERVRADYTKRLQEVVDALRQHTTDLTTHARNLMVRLKELEVSEEELVEEQSENQLRAQVGELSVTEFESSKKKADRLLEKFREDQEQLADDLNAIREILNDATGLATATPASGVPRHSTDFNEMDFLQSVVGQSTAQSPAPAAPRRTPPRPVTPTSNTAYPSSRTSPPVSQPAAPEPKPPKPEPIVVEQPKPSPAEHLTGKAPTPESLAKVEARADAPSNTKTLKCAECGAMNYASEWYCERCGAELANI